MLDGDYDIKKIKKEEHPEYFVWSQLLKWLRTSKI
jgi:hypothetical protein